MTRVRDKGEAFEALEALMLRQMLQSSGAFRAGSTPGAELRRDMFIETLADAVARAGGLGIGRMLERQLGGAADGAAQPARPYAGGASFGGAVPASGIDDLDDPNSNAPLPEDPNAPTIDELQPGAASPGVAPGHTGDVTSPFGRRIHPITGEPKFHTGVDLRAPEGTPIRAAAAGVVREAGPRGGYGNAVEIDHGDGTSTLYAHASALLVGRGDRVGAGQEVARVGQTGQATGPHLHFELRRGTHPVDPGVDARKLLPVATALNRYRERAEGSIAGAPLGARALESPDESE